MYIHLYYFFFMLRNKDITLKKDNNFITKYGCFNSVNLIPEVIYLRTKAKITPLKEKSSYIEDIDKVKKDFLCYIEQQILNNKYIDDRYLFNLDISSKSVNFGKISNLRYDIYLKPFKKKNILEHKNFFERFSLKLDKKLISLLKKNKIECR